MQYPGEAAGSGDLSGVMPLTFGKLSAIVYAPGATVPGNAEKSGRVDERRIDRYVEIYCGSGSGSGSGSGGCHGDYIDKVERELELEIELDRPGIDNPEFAPGVDERSIN
jgi:hypothetical protein